MLRFVKVLNRPGDSAGFTLLEVLVAILILAVSLGVLLRSFSGEFASLGLTTFHTAALAEAKSQIDRIGAEIPLQDGELSGVSEEGLSWVIRLRQDDDMQPRGFSDESGEDRVIPHEVEVVITDGAGRTLTLKTLRLAIVDESGGSLQ